MSSKLLRESFLVTFLLLELDLTQSLPDNQNLCLRVLEGLICHVSIYYEAKFKQTFGISQNRKCESGVFPSADMERMNKAAKYSLVEDGGIGSISHGCNKQ